MKNKDRASQKTDIKTNNNDDNLDKQMDKQKDGRTGKKESQHKILKDKKTTFKIITG